MITPGTLARALTNVRDRGLEGPIADLRRIDLFPDLKAHLMANETIDEFCANAVRRAVQQRKSSVAAEKLVGDPAPEAG